jgi:hypothetical protein
MAQHQIMTVSAVLEQKVATVFAILGHQVMTISAVLEQKVVTLFVLC